VHTSLLAQSVLPYPFTLRGCALVLAAVLALCAPRPAGAATISGLITDPDGRAVPGARILLVQAVAIVTAATSDEQGRFRIDNLPAGSYELRVALEGFQADPVETALAADEEREIPVRLHLSALSESIVVSASQVDVPLSQASQSVTVISSADLQTRQIDTVADALRLVPGLAVTRNGGLGSITSLFPRGGESDFTIVLVDGMRANAFGGGYDFSQLSVAEIERIEVVRGPQSALFGSNAVGAVVQIITKHGGPPRAEATLETGSLGTVRLAATSSGSRGAWSWGGSAEQVTSEGYTGIAQATGEHVSNNDWHSRHASASVGWRTSGGTEVRGSGQITSDELGFPGPFGSNPIGAYTAVDRVSRGVTDIGQVGLKVVHPFASVSGRLRQRAEITYLDLNNHFTSLFGLSNSETRRLTARTQTDLALRASTGVTAGIEFDREQASSTFITGSQSQAIPIGRRTIAPFVEVRHEAGERLTLTGGVRVDAIRRDAVEASPDPYSQRPAFQVDSAVSANPTLSIAYLLRASDSQPDDHPIASALKPSWTRIRAAGGTGIRPPDALEIAFTDNSHLKPERSRSVEIGLEQAFAQGAGVVQATVFLSRFNDLIVAIGPALQNTSRFRTDNISNAQASGLELAASVRSDWGVQAHVAYTLLGTRILAVDRGDGQAPPPFTVGDPLLRRPRHQGSIDVAISRGRVTGYAQLGARSRVLDVEPSWGTYGGLFHTPGYGVAQAGASFQIVRRVQAFARVSNLLDHQYEETLGFPALGRTVTTGIRVAAGK
jgi:outer membrane cobalamin receptor